MSAEDTSVQSVAILRYSKVAIGFHWLLALMIVGSLGVGLYMSDLPFSPMRVKLYNWHKWAGITILLLAGSAGGRCDRRHSRRSADSSRIVMPAHLCQL